MGLILFNFMPQSQHSHKWRAMSHVFVETEPCLLIAAACMCQPKLNLIVNSFQELSLSMRIASTRLSSKKTDELSSRSTKIERNHQELILCGKFMQRLVLLLKNIVVVKKRPELKKIDKS